MYIYMTEKIIYTIRKRDRIKIKCMCIRKRQKISQVSIIHKTWSINGKETEKKFKCMYVYIYIYKIRKTRRLLYVTEISIIFKTRTLSLNLMETEKIQSNRKGIVNLVVNGKETEKIIFNIYERKRDSQVKY